MQHATQKQGKRALKHWIEQKAQQNATAHDKFMRNKSNGFKLGARIKPEVFNALMGN